MMTSKAMSKVTNIATVNTAAVSSDFHQRDLADETHEARDQQEARDVKPEPLGEQAEQQRRHEHLHDAAELVARHERFVGRRPAGQQRATRP